MDRKLAGTISAVSAFFLWGFTPLYWSRLRGIPAMEMLVHRVWWSFPLIWLVVYIRRRRGRDTTAGLLADRRTLLWAAGAGILVAANWLIYVWAVSQGRTLDASLGYYMNPLVSVALGTIVLRERLEGLQKAALALAVAGVLYLTIWFGSFPWISIVLACSFGVYGLIKKRIPVGPVESLALEITFIAPFALGYILWQELSGQGAFFKEGWDKTALLFGGGAVTVFPLLLFGYATRAIRLSDVGFIQYISPTMMVLIGVFILKEPFHPTRLPGFVFVWIGLVLYSVSTIRRAKAGRREGTPDR